MKSNIKAVIFDCDGVLVDTEGLKFQAWEKVLQLRGITLSPERYQLLIGHTGRAMLNLLEKKLRCSLDPKIIDEKNREYLMLQKCGLRSIAPMMEVVAWAETKRSKGELLLGVATSASKAEVLFNLDYLKITNVFDVIISGQDDLAHYSNPSGVNKPQPYIYLEVSSLLGLNPSECLVFEDSEPGVCAAKSAGCSVIALPSKWTIQQNFDNANRVLYNADAEEIIECIRDFLQSQKS